MPAVNLWLNDVPQFFDSNGEPLAGGQLFFYLAGSSTKQDTYTTSAGTTPNANPMTLDSAGRPTQIIWLIEGQLYKIGLAAAGEPDPPNNFIPGWPIDNVSGIGDVVSSNSEWIASGFTATYVSGTSFTVPGDQTSVLTPGRAVLIVDAGGSKYGWIKTSAYTVLTTVTLDQNSDALANPISSLSYGILQGTTDTSVPIIPDSNPIRRVGATGREWGVDLQDFTADDTTIRTRVPNYQHRMMTQTKGSDIVCAATIDLDTATGDWCDITGSTGPVTAITLTEGKVFCTRFTGTPTLTNGASLVLLSAADITVEAGDWAVWRAYSGGVVRMEGYSRESGRQLTNRLSTYTALSSTAVVFSGIPAWARRVTVMVNALSTTGTSPPTLVLGDSGGLETSGYAGSCGSFNNASSTAVTNFGSTGFLLQTATATNITHFTWVLTLMDAATNTWSMHGVGGQSNVAGSLTAAGTKSLSATLTQLSITTAGGTDTFDSGSAAIFIEG